MTTVAYTPDGQVSQRGAQNRGQVLHSNISAAERPNCSIARPDPVTPDPVPESHRCGQESDMRFIQALVQRGTFLCRAFRSESTMIRDKRLMALSRMKRRNDVEGLMRKLSNEELISGMPMKLWAVRYLGMIGDHRATIPLASLLRRTESDAVRVHAAIALGRIGDPRAIDTLLACLDDPSLLARARAISSLGEIGDPAAIPHLLRLVGEKEWSIRGSALYALSLIEDATANQTVRDELEDEGWYHRRLLAKALRKRRRSVRRRRKKMGQ